MSSHEDAGPGSLRQAIHDANASGVPDMNMLAPQLAGVIGLTSGPLEITEDVSIVGPGADALAAARTLATNEPLFRVIAVAFGVTADISELTSAGGRAVGSSTFSNGDGVDNDGKLTLTDCVVSSVPHHRAAAK